MPELTNDYHKFIKNLSDLLRRAYHANKRKRILTNIFRGIGVLGFFVFLLMAGEQLFYLSSIIKSGLLLSGILITLASIYYQHRRAPGFDTFKQYYHHLSRQIKNEPVRNILDLYTSDTYKTVFSEPALKQNIRQLSLRDVKQRIRDYHKQDESTHHFRSAGLLILIILFINTGFIFTYPNAFTRSTHFWVSYSRPNPFRYTVAPGDSVIERGSPFQAILHIRGNISPKTSNIALKTSVERAYRVQKMQKINDSTFVSDVYMPGDNVTYHVQMDGYKSTDYHVTVQLKPRFKDLSVTVQPPAYTKLDSVHYHYPFSAINVIPGSHLTLQGTTNKPVKDLVLQRLHSSDTLHSDSGLDSLFTQFQLFKPDSLSFKMTDLSNLTNDNPFGFRLKAIADKPPRISILQPETPLFISQPDTVHISYEMSDDYGFHNIIFHYSLAKAYVKKKKRGVIRLQTPRGKKAQRTFIWDLAKLNLKPLDELTYWIDVRDNDAIAGYKRTRSNIQKIKMASIAETITDAEKDQSAVDQQFKELREGYDNVQQDFENFQNNLRNNPDNTWKHQQSLEKIRKEQQDLNKKVDEISNKFDEVKKKLQKNNLVSKETQDKYKELQKLIKQIKDPALLKALKELQKSMNNLGQEQIQQALQNYKFNESLYKERLQRTIELFKSLKLNAELENMTRNLENLKSREDSLMQKQAGPSEQLQEQQQIQKNLRDVAKKLDKMNNGDIPERARGMMKKLQKETHQSYQKADENLQKNLEELQKRRRDNQLMQQQQQQAGQQMSQMIQSIKKAQKSLNQKKAHVNLMALQSILQDLMLLSDEQEKISVQVSELPDGSKAFVEQARRQTNVSQSFEQVVDSLSQVAKEVPELSNAIIKKKKEAQVNLKQSQSYLADRDQANASAEVRTALGNINDLSSMIASLIDQMKQSGQSGGGGMGGSLMEQLQKLSQQQKGLNDQLQNLINDLQGNRLTESQMQRFNQLARTQNQIREQLQRIQKGGELQPGDKTLSELQRLSDQMDQAINDMRGGSKDRPFIQRQQNILSRMLSAEKAVQERGKSKKRQSESADQTLKAPPPQMTMQQLQEELRKRLQSDENTPFSSDYQKLIERYYQLLQEEIKN